MNFYIIQKPVSESESDRAYGTDCDKTDHVRYNDAIHCAKCLKPISMRQWLPPFEVELTTYGRQYADFLECISDMLVSDRFIEVYRNSELKGFDEFSPAQIVKLRHRTKKPAEPIPHLFRVPVKMSMTTIDQVVSEYEWEDCSKICPCCLTGPLIRYKAQIVDQSTWDGLDVFKPRGGKRILVSQRFVDTCQQHNLKMGDFIPSETFGYDGFPWKKGVLQG